MKRVRQETAESYEVTAVEVALALGLFVEEGDEVTLSHQYGDKYRIKVTSVTEEAIELEAPVYDPILESYGRAYVAEAVSEGIIRAVGEALGQEPETVTLSAVPDLSVEVDAG